MHHVIFVPGLGDHKPQGQNLVPGYWRFFGAKGHYFPMTWNDKLSFASKLEKLLAKIDRLAADGSLVSLVGTSAGASAVLVAYAARLDKVTGVVCICGKINHPETIEPYRYVENPAFKESMAELQRTLPKLSLTARERIMSIHPLYDGTVPITDTMIPGAREKTIFAIAHAPSIFIALTFGAFSMLRFLRQQADRAANQV